MVAPEGGSWVLDEVNVSSSRTNHMDRFVCRRRLGGRRGEPAAYLTPVPPGAVVYGSGDAARILTREQAAALRGAGLDEYADLKSRLLLATALLAGSGSCAAALAGGPAAAVPFAIGGAAGLLYQLLLQVGADAAVASAAAAARGGGPGAGVAPEGGGNGAGGWGGALGSGPVRFGLLAVAAIAAASALVHPPAPLTTAAGAGAGAGGAAAVADATAAAAALAPREAAAAFAVPAAEPWQLGCAVLGFAMYKVAILGVGLVPGGAPGAGEALGTVARVESNERKAS